MIKFGKKKKASAESKRDKLIRGTIGVFKEFDEYLKQKEQHRLPHLRETVPERKSGRAEEQL